MEKEYRHQIHVQNEGYKKPGPATAPKPFSASPTPYNPGPQTYRSVRVANYQEDNNYPPPPPPDSLQYNYSPDEEFPPPPPPAPPQTYGEDDSHIYGNVYSGEARFMRTDEYRQGQPQQVLRHAEGKMGPQYPLEHSQKPESNYANIQINIAPPTPTSKESGYQGRPDLHAAYESMGSRGGQSAHSHPPAQERPVPGPMVPPSGLDYQQSGPVSPPNAQNKQEKEAEVDALTDLLLKNMTAPSSAEESSDYWGLCGRCGGTVSGENNACTALDNVYHSSCFTCVGCNAALHGKSFFAMEGKPYCESCYVNTLERCSICSKPITDRLLRATGKPYHPDCFTCVVCGKSLDGIPFTVDATNQIHCIEDFHKKFAPRCCMCQHPIMPSPGQEETVRIVAMDKSFHVDCYRCEDCHCQLSSEAEGKGCYPLDDHILCKNCNAKRIQALTTRMSTEL